MHLLQEILSRRADGNGRDASSDKHDGGGRDASCDRHDGGGRDASSDRHDGGRRGGIYSICSANELVIQAAMEESVRTGGPLLIEATANQVNQYGGYTGMTPVDFYNRISILARQTGVDDKKLILGGDHLGPFPWRNEPASAAMDKAERLVRDFVSAGYTKIHIDASMPLADDAGGDIPAREGGGRFYGGDMPAREGGGHSFGGDMPAREGGGRFSDEVVAGRAARLAAAAEDAYRERLSRVPCAQAPVYVIGSEVPVPGGVSEPADGINITRPEHMLESLQSFKSAFSAAGLDGAFSRVIAIVVQPGVEFGDTRVTEYDRKKASTLTGALPDCGGLVYEGHSTDYQTKYKLREMVEDGIAVLKVGPALTFALREAFFALESIEKELMEENLSNFQATLENSMLANPENWNNHYRGDERELFLKRRYSLSDRCRYYLPDARVRRAADVLIKNINSADIPMSLYSQYLPTVYTAIREGRCAADAESVLKMRVKDCIADYIYATSAGASSIN